MASYVEIANVACSAIGGGIVITDPLDDRRVARKIKSVWDLQRRATIREGGWNFAMRRFELAALAGVSLDGLVLFPFAYAYQLPADCLRLIEVLECPQRTDYQQEGGKILCNVSGPLHGRYLTDVTESAEWDDDFAHAFGLRIAWKIGHDIAGSTYDRDNGWRRYQDALAVAGRTDALENPPIEQEESDWITARFNGVYG